MLAQCSSTILGDVEDFTVATQRIDFEHYPDGSTVPMGADDLDDEFLAFGIRIYDSSPATGARAYTSTLGIPAHSGVNALADSDADAGGFILFQFVNPSTGADTRYTDVGLWIQTGDAGDTVAFLDSDGLSYCTITTPPFGDYFVGVHEPQGVAAVRVSSDGWYLADDLEFGGQIEQPESCTIQEKGDVDGNGLRDGADIAEFVQTLLDPDGASEATRCRADTGGPGARCTPDNLVSVDDVAGIVQILLVEQCNEPPVFTLGETLAFDVPKESECPSQENEILIEAADPDGPSAELEWAIDNPPATGTASFVGPAIGSVVTLCYAPDSNQAEQDTLSLRITDVGGDSASCLVTVSVINHPPSIDQGPIASLDVSKNSHCPGAGNSLMLTATDEDDANSSLEWSLSSLPNHGTAAIESNSGGTEVSVCYEPDANQAQPDSFAVRVVDPYGAEDEIDVSVTVSNASPSIAEGPTATMTVVANSDCDDARNIIELNAMDADDDDEMLSWEITAAAVTGSADFLDGDIGPIVRVCYLPQPGQTEPDAFELRVSDGFGGFDAIAVDVAFQLSPPEILEGVAASMSIAKNSLCIFTENRMVLHATDPDGDDGLLQWSIADPPATGYVDLPDGQTGGAVTICYEPDLDQIESDAFAVRVRDADDEFADIVVDVSVHNAPPSIDQGDDPLTMRVDADSTCNDAPNLIVLTATDPDDLDTTLVWDIESLPMTGAVSFVGVDIGKSVTVCYTPNPGQADADQFVIRVSDGFGGEDTITAIVSVDP
ncbi:MAG: Ig-like domain-containing protein [Phycisphaerales bacterium]|nr:Ig-like domain-containing protein [Phycisphaerales bacterium]